MPSFVGHTLRRCATITTPKPSSYPEASIISPDASIISRSAQLYPDVHVVRTTKKVVSRGPL
jgi:hypothetical protein